MTAQLLATELTNLIQESKRKHSDLRQAAEKSLDELKGLRASSEAQIGAELSQKAAFVNPFVIACGTKNTKFTGIAIVCLQRLIVIRALPRPRLSHVLEALSDASSAGLDVQLKILQALPSLLQNYSSDIKADLLVTALNICFTLQSSKNAIVNNTSAATLQQLVVSVFDKVVAEDKTASESPPAGEAPVGEGTVPLRAAALDAYRVFNDICLLTNSKRPDYLRFSGLSQPFGLELIESVLTNHAGIFSTHPEQAHILRTTLMPFTIQSLSGKPNFPTTVRLVRILFTLLRRHISLLPSESGDALTILTHLLDQDTALWKRALCMEVFRGIFAEPGLLRRIFMLYDGKNGQKKILRSLTATFVRISTEKPSTIGLGQQSTIPVANPYASIASSTDQAMLEASGVTGIISGSIGSESSNTGISTQWSTMRVPCVDQLDKTEAPSIPDTYVYSLTLSCITSLSEGLAKFVLPLTVPGDSRTRKRSSKQDSGRDSPIPAEAERSVSLSSRIGLERSGSFKRNPVPVNPLQLEDHPLYADIKACAGIIDECWPAILATCSTFLYAALDSEYYHSLVRAFQRFTHVAGLLQLTTPRDAFLTTLGKAAVPPNVFTVCMNSGNGGKASTPSAETPSSGILSNARGLLSVDSLVSQASSVTEKPRQQSVDGSPTTLNTRNLLCLRALVNLGIALGPTLGSSWQIVVETLQQADFVLFSSGKTAGRTPTASRTQDQQADGEANALLANFNTEIKAVETAASRLFESTVDFPNPAFVEVVAAVCNLLEKTIEPPTPTEIRPQSPPSGGSLPRHPHSQHKRVLSISTAAIAGPNQQDQFALAKLGDLASINLERLLTSAPEASGWNPLVSELANTLSSTSATPPVRIRAAEILVRVVLEAANAVAAEPDELRGVIQLRLLEAFRDGLAPIQLDERGISVAAHGTDVDIHRIILDGLKSILENCGETLVSGWELTFEIIDSIFVTRRFPSASNGDPDSSDSFLMTRSTKLIKPSFSSLQLICSDFLSSLPNSCFLRLVDTLYKFCSQEDDLNVALTTVTFFWAISDFLSGKSRSMSITEAMMEGSNDKALVELASDPTHPGSGAALWMLLLLRLTTVTTDSRLELRNSAIQTLLRIVNAYGNSLSPEAWSICMKSVIFRLLTSIESRLRTAHEKSANGSTRSDWDDTAVVIVNGVSSLLANYLDVLTAHPSFASLWQELLMHFATMLDFKALDINSATFSSLGSILSKCEEGSKRNLDKKTIDTAWELWARGLPIPDSDSVSEDNQKCLLSWVEALLELHRLIQTDLDLERVLRMLTLLRSAMMEATPGSYANDIEYVTPVQGRILEIFKLVRSDIPGVPSALITQLAEFAALAFGRTDQSASRKRTFVAMSKDSMPILHFHITKNASDPEIFASGAFSAALGALAQPIVLNYRFPIVTKSIQPWREATKATLAILETTLPHLKEQEIPPPLFQEIWQVIVAISNGIISADGSSAAAAANIVDDQQFDIDSFRSLRELIVPALGAEAVPEKTRKIFAEGLFRNSIIHAPAPAETALIFGNAGHDVVGKGLSELYKPRNGRTIDPPPTKREKMSYVCLDELFSLVAAHDEAAETPSIVVQPPTPRFPKKMTHGPPPSPDGEADTTHGLHVRLARTAAPYLILRCALSLRAYNADHPLRGHMPQPLSQRRELARVLRCLVDLRSEPGAIPDAQGVESESRKHLLRLYPLLVRAGQVAGTAGDDKVLGLVGEALEVVGGELGV